MSAKVADFVFTRLADWGVNRVFGYPGDGINGLMGGLARAGDRFKLVRTSHEEMAAFMACATIDHGRPGLGLALREDAADSLQI